MEFHFQIDEVEAVEGEKITRVPTIRIETYSFHPRTNKRKLRKFLASAWGIKPQYIKYVLKTMGFWEPERLGVVDPLERQAIYKEALAWQERELNS
ncbi:hypothetical protein VPHK436_0037 [Vibrio phage K436]